METLDQLVVNGDVIIESDDGDSEVGDPIFQRWAHHLTCYGVPVLAGGISLRDIINPHQDETFSNPYTGDSEWKTRVINYLNTLEANANNFIRVGTIIYWQNEKTYPSTSAVANTEYLFTYDTETDKFKLDVSGGDENRNTEWLRRLTFILSEAQSRDILVQLDLFDNPILRGFEDIRWESGPFYKCLESQSIWGEFGPPDEGTNVLC